MSNFDENKISRQASGTSAGGQFAKILIDFAKNKKMNWREFFKSGHMPSTHTASMVALTTAMPFVVFFVIGTALFVHARRGGQPTRGH